MSGSYHMVIVSLVSSLALLMGAIFYYSFFPKKKNSLFILLLLILVPPIISIFRPGIYESGDFTIHIYRSIEFYRSIAEGHLMPSWAGGLNATYGYPLFIFNYTLPYYLICLFHFLGFSFVMSMKLFLAINFILSGIFMYFCSKKLFKNDLAAFVSSIFYQFAPYHLVDLHFRVAVGEIVIFTILPLVFLLLQKLWEKSNSLIFALSSLSVALLIMSHVVLAMLTMILLLGYSIFLSLNLNKWEFFFRTLGVFVLGSLSSLYVWATPFFMSKYTIMSKILSNVSESGSKLWELLYSPWRLGFLFQGPKGELNTPLGYTHIFVVILLLVLLSRKEIASKYKYHVIFWICTFFILTFLVSEYSVFIWNKAPFLTSASHRVVLLVAFVTSILAGFLALKLFKKKVIIWLLIGFTVYSTILNWGQRRVIPTMGDKFLIKNVPKSTYEGEAHWYADSAWRNVKDLWFRDIPKQHIDIMKGEGQINELQRSSTEHNYLAFAKTDLNISENTLYFPGWQVYINGNLIQSAPDINGIIAFKIPRGLHYIHIEYRDIFIYKTLKVIGATVFFGTLIFLFYRLCIRRRVVNNQNIRGRKL